jgi:hypothetical protein
VFLEDKVLRISQHVVECRGATQPNRPPRAPELGRVVGVVAEDCVELGRSRRM